MSIVNTDKDLLTCAGPRQAITEDRTASDSVEPASLVESLTGRWWVLHTRSRNEKAVAGYLVRWNVPHYLPLVQQRRKFGGTIKHVCIPLFPGYVFLCGSQEDRFRALQTNRLANVLDVPNQAQLKQELRQIERVLNSGVQVDLYPRLRKGTRCRVTSGSLIGLVGVVLRRRGPWRVYIGVEFVGQSAELEIDPAMLEVLD